MSEMVARVVQAINQVAQTHGQHGHLRARPLSADMAAAMARAAIAAMREPAAEMLVAFVKKANEDLNQPPRKGDAGEMTFSFSASDGWRAMIDAALDNP